MFKVINVRGNSVRINIADLLSFDVQVIILPSGKKIIKKPNGIYIDEKGMSTLVKTVFTAYEFNEGKVFNDDNKKVSNRS